MKLAIVRQKYRVDGGAERFVSEMVNTLSGSKKLEISIITRSWEKRGVSDHKVITCNPHFIGRKQRGSTFADSAKKYFSQFDIIQSHERIPGCDIFRAGDGVHRAWLHERMRTLNSFQQRLLASSRFHRYLIQQEEEMYRHPALKAVICNSQMVADEIFNYFSLPKEKIHLIYNQVSTKNFNPQLRNIYRNAIRKKLGIPDDKPVMLFVGSGFERKGLSGAIYAAGKSAEKPHLVVVGKGKPNLHYFGLIKKMKLRGRFHFVGKQDDVRPYYGAADMLLLPTLYDPFPNVVLEAMASGLGVITSHKCGGKEFIEEGKNGFIRDSLDYDGLSEAVDRAYATGFDTLGAHARSVIEKYNTGSFSQNMLDLYQKLI